MSLPAKNLQAVCLAEESCMQHADDNVAGLALAAGTNPGDEAEPGTPGTGEDICPVCSGKGKVDGRECQNCGGTGKVIEGIGGG